MLQYGVDSTIYVFLLFFMFIIGANISLLSCSAIFCFKHKHCSTHTSVVLISILQQCDVILLHCDIHLIISLICFTLPVHRRLSEGWHVQQCQRPLQDQVRRWRIHGDPLRSEGVCCSSVSFWEHQQLSEQQWRREREKECQEQKTKNWPSIDRSQLSYWNNHG